MAPKHNIRAAKARLDKEIADLDERRAELDHERALLAAARKGLEPRQLSQDEVAEDLAEHPESTYLEVARRLGARPTVIAAHLNRGKTAGRFQNDGGKWSIREGKL
jgi:hypothetical protein